MTPLGRLIRELIAAEGPIGIDRYMALALGYPVHGYYATRDPFGAAGDFVTAPEISQMFGELLGLWAATVWTAMGRPRAFALCELGPGRGTLMSDALRAAQTVPGFLDAASVHLVETSPVLRDAQARALAGSGPPVTWHATLAEVPRGPLIALANEFLDALPIRQFVRTPDGWCERLVGLGTDGTLAFGLAPEPEPSFAAKSDGSAGEILEVASAAQGVARELAQRVATEGGAALLVDYGHVAGGTGDTLQAVRLHGFVDLLAEPGEADVTAHVDFAALGRAGAKAGGVWHGPVDQATFLEALGIRERAGRLAASAPDARRADGVRAALARLTARERGGMGSLFKVVAVADPSLPSLPGLPAPRRASARSAPQSEPMGSAC